MQKIIALVCFTLMFSSLYSQIYFGNFYGEDSDNINGRFNFEIPLGFPIPIKKFDNKTKIIVSPRYTYAQSYFNDKWIFSTDGNSTTASLDTDPSHEYTQSLFTHQSKILTWSWEAWFGVEKTFGKTTLDLFYAPTYIQTGSFRRKFTQDNEVVKVKDKFKDKADYYNINRFQHKIYTSLSYYGIGLGAYVNLTPFFKSTLGPALNKYGITLIIRDTFTQYILGDIMDVPTPKKKPDVKEMKF